MPANTMNVSTEGELLELRRLFQKKRPPSRKVPTQRKSRMRVYLRVTDDLAEAIQMLAGSSPPRSPRSTASWWSASGATASTPCSASPPRLSRLGLVLTHSPSQSGAWS